MGRAIGMRNRAGNGARAEVKVDLRAKGTGKGRGKGNTARSRRKGHKQEPMQGSDPRAKSSTLPARARAICQWPAAL